MISGFIPLYFQRPCDNWRLVEIGSQLYCPLCFLYCYLWDALATALPLCQRGGRLLDFGDNRTINDLQSFSVGPELQDTICPMVPKAQFLQQGMIVSFLKSDKQSISIILYFYFIFPNSVLLHWAYTGSTIWRNNLPTILFI